MAGHEAADGSVDNLMTITKNVASSYFYAPSLPELKKLLQEGATNVNNNSNIENSNKQQIVPQQLGDPDNAKSFKVFIEFCTNCGYKQIFLDKKKAMEAVSSAVRVIGNPKLPRLSAFEVTTEDGTVLWSKLNQAEGKHNIPSAFPTDEYLVEALQKLLGLELSPVVVAKAAIYKEGNTVVGVW